MSEGIARGIPTMTIFTGLPSNRSSRAKPPTYKTVTDFERMSLPMRGR